MHQWRMKQCASKGWTGSSSSSSSDGAAGVGSGGGGRRADGGERRVGASGGVRKSFVAPTISLCPSPQREELREKSVRIRAAFEANAAVANPQEVENLCARAELLLAYYAHPQPIVYPTGHGGTKWERNMPFPEHMINRLTPYDDSS
ncbi:hypothetical protein DFJ73DRAFT_793970 [Zopfochytrium polystomum]|nr:hypothetical protein DFJ73DRAFT_793970 [Zopfochytrium polystomum]